MAQHEIRPFRDSDERELIALWEICQLTRPWNDPHQDIRRKQSIASELFFVGTMTGQLVTSVMGGYDGHRGWVNYLAVHPDYRRRGLGREMMHHLEDQLRRLGCPKVNLQVRVGNQAALAFYEQLNFERDEVISLGKRLVVDGAGTGPTSAPQADP